VRSAIPLRMPAIVRWRHHRAGFALDPLHAEGKHGVEAVLAPLHNATEACAKRTRTQRESCHHPGGPPPADENNLQERRSYPAASRARPGTRNGEALANIQPDAVNLGATEHVGRIHEFLSQDGRRPINVRERYARRIADQGHPSLGAPGSRSSHPGAGAFGAAARQPGDPLAMVVNELLLNAVEHGLKDRAQGTDPDSAGKTWATPSKSRSSTTGARAAHQLLTQPESGRPRGCSVVQAAA
jgi:hypothetical protein